MSLLISGDLRCKNYGTPNAIAGVASTLDYRFALDRREIEAVSLTDKLTFTRSATCGFINQSGRLELAGVNTPRFTHDETTNLSLGLLLEVESSNRVLFSESQAGWSSQASGSATASSTLSPANTGGVTRVQGTTTNDGVSRTSSLAAAGNHTASVYIRSRTGSDQSVKVTQSGNVGATLSVPGSGNWVRFTGQTSNLGSGNRDVRILAATANPIDIDVWGLQTEPGSLVSSYIQTTGSAVTRTESATIDGIAVITGTYTLVENPVGCAVVNGTNIDLVTGYIAERVMVFPAALSGDQITAIRGAM